MQNYDAAATLKNRESALRSRLQEMETQWKEQMTRCPVEIDEQAICEVVASMTGIPVTRISGQRTTPAQRDGRSPRIGRHRTGRGRFPRNAGHPPQPGRAEGRQPSDRRIHVRRADRRRQDPCCQTTGQIPVRQRGSDDPHRHERIFREAQRKPPDRFASGLRRLRRRRTTNRKSTAPPLLRTAVRRDRKKRTATYST